MAITAINAKTPRKINPIVIKSASQVATPLRISQRVAGKTVIPIIPANRKELNIGALNFIAWPMMFLSEVWFSLEGAPQWVRTFSQFLPLTHLLQAARKVMNDGATLAQVGGECLVMLGITFACLILGALLFSWNE